MKKNNKVSLLDWRFKIGILFLVLSLILLVVALVLLSLSTFIDRHSLYLGDGFWMIGQKSLKDLLFNWVVLDDSAIKEGWISHQFLNVFVSLIFLVFLFPLFLLLALFLILRWWIKTRI